MSLGKTNLKSFGEKKELHWFLSSVFSKRESIAFDDLKSMYSLLFKGNSLDGLVFLFQKLNLIKVNKTSILRSRPKTWALINDEPENLIQSIIKKLKEDNEYDFFFEKDFILFENGHLFFIGKMIPYQFVALRNLMISLEVFEQTEQDGIYKVQSKFINILGIEPKINLGKKFTQSDLEKGLENRNLNFKKAGEVAEKWVLSYEKKKYKKFGKNFTKQIQRISQDYSRAGFDIVSYIDELSQFPDKLIEVKSYNVDRHFYWTENEINRAFTERDSYYIYLVDRSLINTPDYNPIQLKDPAEKIFNSKRREYLIQTSDDGVYKIYSERDGWKIEF